ncbi:MerR family transcriptional regulator [Nocardiopsis sediminis]|uniref:MerR family transcriptional regulator n=1 Tax=Nocardiopsis sediminis TaxID=1778267 RepID=A0ABV8FLT3_9ACTN
MRTTLTAGEFQLLTGLSAKALRLYAERGILPPAFVDAGSGYRHYAPSQIQHGATIGLLRRARVPLSELATASEFPFGQWREAVRVRRQLEDFYLDVAERVAAFDPARFTAHTRPAPALEWIGVIIGLDIPDAFDEHAEAFTALSVSTPAVDDAFAGALAELGAEPAPMCWTAVPDTGTGGPGAQMLLARPWAGGADERTRALIEQRVRSGTGQDVRAVAGTLPQRDEVTFAAAQGDEFSPVDEAASGFLHVLAFEEHAARHGLARLGRSARQVVHGPSLFSGDAQGEPVSVFDARPAGVS